MRNISGLSGNGISSPFLGSRRGPPSWDFTGGSLPAGVTFTRAGSATYFDANGLMQTAAADQPRFDHDPVTKAPKGLLIEGARANLLLRSIDVGNAAWAKQNATVTVGATPSPLGLAADVVETATSATHGINQAVNVTTETVYTLSFYAKAKGRHLMRAGVTNINAYAVFDLSVGAVQHTDTDVSAKIEAVGGGWYRCSVTQTAATTGGYNCILRTQSSTSEWPGSGVYTGDGVSGVSIIGAQLEAGTFPSSYIPTTTAAATRAADTAVMTGADFSRWFNPLEGTIAVDFSLITNGLKSSGAADFPHIYDIDQTAVNTSGHILVASASYGPGVLAHTRSAGVVQAEFTHAATLGTGAIMRHAYAYKANDFAACLNGAAVQTDSLGILPAPDRLSIGSQNAGGGNALDGHIRRLRYWPTRLPNTRLQETTA